MIRHLNKLARAGRIGHATLALIVLGIILIAGTAGLFLSLLQRQQSVINSVREDAMWASFQTDREASRLIEAIIEAEADPTPDALDNVGLRFDLVYSRGTLLTDGMFSDKFSTSSEIQSFAEATERAIQQMAKAIDPVLGRDELMREALPNLSLLADAIREETTRLLVATNETLNALRVGEREITAAEYGRLAIGVAFMTLVFVSIVALQFAQVAQISRTERRLWHLSLRNARTAKAAQAASDAKTRFLATMSHEIRTPLNGIIGAADLLQNSDLSHEQESRVSTIRSSGYLLLDVITDILDYSKLEADAVTFSFSPVYLPDLAKLLTTVLKPRADAAGLEFRVDLPDCQVVTDAIRLRQVLVNLIGNAIKFTSTGSITIAGEIRDDETLRITVTDTGVGIPKADQDKLFKDFSQIDNSASRRFDGTGLGLAISKRIMKGLGGTIGLDSDVGVGSVFWLELPAEEIVWASPQASNLPHSEVELPARFDARVLLVEDNRVNRDVATAILENLGVTVSIAQNGQEAVDILSETDFDLVFMDLQMPVLDGLAATRAIRDRGQTVPIVGLTANAFEDDRRSCLEAGMNEFTTKPITARKLQSVLAGFVQAANEREPEDDEQRDLIDVEQYRSIVSHTGRDAYLKMVSKLGDDVRAAADCMAEKGVDWPAEERDHVFHSIKGAALTLGLSSLGHLAEHMRDTDKAAEMTPDGLLSVARSSIEAVEGLA